MTIKLYFSAFCNVIYQNILRKSVYIAVSSYKLIFIHFVKNRRISSLTRDGVQYQPKPKRTHSCVSLLFETSSVKI